MLNSNVTKNVISGSVSLASAFGLAYIVCNEVAGGRGEYQVPFFLIVGVLAAFPVMFWVVKRTKGIKRVIAKSVVFTLFCTPVPYGPEGTLSPLVVTLLFPPLIFLFLYPGRIILAFLFFFGLFYRLSGTRQHQVEVSIER